MNKWRLVIPNFNCIIINSHKCIRIIRFSYASLNQENSFMIHLKKSTKIKTAIVIIFNWIGSFFVEIFLNNITARFMESSESIVIECWGILKIRKRTIIRISWCFVISDNSRFNTKWLQEWYKVIHTKFRTLFEKLNDFRYGDDGANAKMKMLAGLRFL